MLQVEAKTYQSFFAGRPLDDSLLQEFRSLICHDLVPNWAGQWRSIEVQVGNLVPSPVHQIPLLMKNYGADLETRWTEASY